jgi:hypothetical protein
MSKKKVFDIVPPKQTERTDRLRPDLKHDAMSGLKSAKLIALLGLIGVIVVVGFLMREVFSEPEVLEIVFEVEVAVSRPDLNDARSGLDVAFVSGEILTIESSLSQEFPATGVGSKDEKAKGIIRVYNNYSQVAQVFVTKTRFLSHEGKQFRTQEKITIPGMGWVDVEVIADQPGKEYNIGPSTFSIPGLAGTAGYTSFYGKSSSPMTGGRETEAVIVDKQDLEKAKETLTQNIFVQGKNDLDNKFGADFGIFKETIKQEIIEFSSSAKAGQEIDFFTGRIKIESKAFGFRKTDLADFAKEYILRELAGKKEFLEESLEIEYAAFDVKDNEAKLECKASAQISP